MNPLLAEYNKRRTSLNVVTARGARDLLLASIHEAGHWVAFAHFKVPVVWAEVDRGPRVGAGCITPADFTGLVRPDQKPRIGYVTTLAGPAASCALIPFESMAEIKAACIQDEQDAKGLLDKIAGGIGRADLRNMLVEQTDKIIRQKWPIVEALAFVLMKAGKLNWHECPVIERRYGIGRDDLTAVRRASAQQRLGAFHSSPDKLLEVLLADK